MGAKGLLQRRGESATTGTFTTEVGGTARATTERLVGHC